MNNKIYGIFEGEYSDWVCIGYIENEEDAYRFCAEAEERNKFYYPYVMEIERIDCEFSNKTVYYEYECTFKEDESGCRTWIALKLSSLHFKPPKIEETPVPKGTHITFMSTTLDPEIAKKTAYDLYAKWKCEKGLNV